jgi:hypothetical protein
LSRWLDRFALHLIYVIHLSWVAHILLDKKLGPLVIRPSRVHRSNRDRCNCCCRSTNAATRSSFISHVSSWANETHTARTARDGRMDRSVGGLPKTFGSSTDNRRRTTPRFSFFGTKTLSSYSWWPYCWWCCFIANVYYMQKSRNLTYLDALRQQEPDHRNSLVVPAIGSVLWCLLFN